MPLYESVLIARNDVSQAQVEGLVENIEALLTENGGSIRKREFWGLRSLAYRIKKNRKGHYVLLGIDCAPATLNELERQLGLNEDVLRVLTLRVEAIDEAPSPILARRNDDRGDRGERGGFRGGSKPSGRFESGRGRRGDGEREEYRARGDHDDGAHDGLDGE